jgi:anti-anti-sigma regulatory factor
MEVSADLQITDLAGSDHACLTFGDAQEQLDLTAAFVRDGLSGGLKVVWISDSAEQLVTELAERGVEVESALASGQMTAVPCEGQMLTGQAFASVQALRWLNREIAAYQDEGFGGLRVAVDMSWALRPISGVEQLPDFEGQVAAALRRGDAALLCQYDREKFDPITLASVAVLHSRSVAAATYHADPTLRICRQYAPPGIRLAGEIDYRAQDPLALALAEALRLDGDITVNMDHLSFIDAACMTMVVNAARSLGGSRRVILRCLPGIANRFVLSGAAQMPGVSVVTVHDR